MRGLPDNGKLNDALVLAEEQLLDCYRTHRAQGQLPNAEALRTAVVQVEQVATTAAITFWQHVDEWIAYKHMAGLVGTARTYATAARHLREFSQAQGYAVDFDTITPSFGDKFGACSTWSKREPDIMTLTADELRHLATLPLPAGGYFDNARGLFVLNCYTGLRYPDLVSIRAEHARRQLGRTKELAS